MPGNQILYTNRAPLESGPKLENSPNGHLGEQEIGFLCESGQMMPRLPLSQMSFIKLQWVHLTKSNRFTEPEFYFAPNQLLFSSNITTKCLHPYDALFSAPGLPHTIIVRYLCLRLKVVVLKSTKVLVFRFQAHILDLLAFLCSNQCLFSKKSP